MAAEHAPQEETEPATCGRGLAERSALPTKLSALSAAMADMLERHQQTLDPTDENARAERDAYQILAKDCRSLASHLHATAGRMAGYRDLPMARHDVYALVAPAIRDGLANLVRCERDVVGVLEGWVERDQRMLDEMSAAAG